jgi:predicted outer membrane protein
MKTPVALLALLTMTCAPLAPAAETPATATPAAKKPLSASDKLLIKNAGEAQLAIIHLADLLRQPTSPGSATVKSLATSANKLNEVWGDLGGLAVSRGAEMPKTEQTAPEKKELAEIRKATGDKFDKAYLKALTRETKKAGSAFVNGEKYAVDPDLKAVFAKWVPVVSKLEADTAAAEAGLKK